MTINILGTSIHEFDVAITDLVLCLETLLFAFILYRKKSAHITFRKLCMWLFVFLSLSSLLGGFFHAFFPDKATTSGGFAIWISTALSIGLTAAVGWLIDSYILGSKKLLKITLPFTLVYLTAFVYVLFFVDYQFKTIILFYSPPMILLTVISLWKLVTTKKKLWLWLLTGLILSFLAAAAQYLQINIHPVYFNYNALYHLIQGIGLALLFLSFRKILAETY